MTAISDEYMREMMGKTKAYVVVILKSGPSREMPGADKIVWEHGRRNFALREQGLLSIVLPVRDASDVSGVGVFTYEAHETRSFPDDCLPA